MASSSTPHAAAGPAGAVTTLDWSSKGLVNITGLGAFPGLTTLALDNNGIYRLTGLEHNVQLQKVRQWPELNTPSSDADPWFAFACLHS